MRNYSRSWLNLGLSSLAIAGVLITLRPVSVSAASLPAIARTSQVGNVGGPLARQLQGKPTIAYIYASWCPACRNIAPTISQLRQEYAGQVNFVVLDVSDRSTARQAEATARQLGLGRFFDENKSQTGLVAIIDPGTGNVLTQHRNNADRNAYASVLNAALSR